MPTLLIVDDERNTRDALSRFLKRRYNVLAAEDGPTALEVLSNHAVDVVLSDIRMPGMDGLELLAKIRERHPSVAVIMLTAYGEVETAVEAMKGGAADYLSKPVHFDDLVIRIDRALHSSAMEAENSRLHRQLDAKYGMENIIGTSPAMEAVFDIVRQAAPSQATVLIQGPSGTGKELVAHAIHQLSPRA
jgi:DNA-binding NtrC family response regulator